MAREGIAGPDDIQQANSPRSLAALVTPAPGPDDHAASADLVAISSANGSSVGSVDRPGAGMPARAAAKAPRVVEAKRPYHLGVALGVAAGLYAASLALVTRLQVDHDQALITDRQPVRDAIELLDRHHDAMDEDLNVAATAYDDAAGGYDQLVVELADVHSDVASLAKRLRVIRRLAVVDGSGLAGVPRVVIAAGAISPPAKAASRTSHKSAPPPVVTKTGASGGG